MIEPYNAVGLIPTVWGISKRAEIFRNIEHHRHIIKAALWLSDLDFPVKLIILPEGALQGFNDDDIWAREAMQKFYADETGWLREQLFEADGNILEWRKLASRHNRGIQAPEHLL